MCLVCYPDLLPRLVHDEIMKVLESEVGQQAENLADALFRNIMANGHNTLEALHREGFIKKVPANQVIVQANAKSSVRLDELNNIINEMKKGDEAIRKLAEMDSNAGMSSGRREPREVGAPARSAKPAEVPVGDTLTDSDLAEQRISQAEKMKASAAQLIAEAERLMAEASELNPRLKVNGKKTKVKAH